MISLYTAQRLSQENSEVTLTRADKRLLKKWEKKIDNEILSACDINERSLLIKRLLIFDKGTSDSMDKSSKKYLRYKKQFDLFLTLLEKYEIQGYKVSYTGATYGAYWDFDYFFYSYRLRGIITNLEIKWDKDYNPLQPTKDETNDLIKKYEK